MGWKSRKESKGRVEMSDVVWRGVSMTVYVTRTAVDFGIEPFAHRQLYTA